MSQPHEVDRRGVGHAAFASRARGSQAVRVLEADRQLGSGLEGERLGQARSCLTGRMLALEKGRLSHRMLAVLVGARSPTVSTALAELAREAVVVRYADGTWLLAQGAPPRSRTPPAPRIPNGAASSNRHPAGL